jgi:CDP-2,3-bis-(O-geranylgeranyl)-sn-glycerol synthase
MVFDIFTLVEGFWVIIPAYAANGLAPLIKYRKNLHPIDFNRSFRGNPLFGKGKTWEGFFLGVSFAVAFSLLEQAAFPYLPWRLSEEIHGVTLNIVPMSPVLGFFLGLGAMGGDLAGSFIKRRLGLSRGMPAPVLDQDDFVAGAFLMASMLVTIEAGWVALYLIVTPLAHLLANFIGYRLGIKKEPW